MAWVDVTKAYDTVDHDGLCQMMEVHRFPRWLGSVVTKLCSTWNTKIVTTTKLNKEISETIQFKRGLPQGDSQCPRLFTIFLNPIAWSLKATEGYRLSKLLSTRLTDLLYIDDLKIYPASEQKLNAVLRSTIGKMQDSGLQWNPNKCSVVHVKKGVKVEDVEGVKLDEASVIQCLKEGKQYKFLGVLETSRQQDQLAFEVVSEEYLKSLSVIWSSPLSDYHHYNRVDARIVDSTAKSVTLLEMSCPWLSKKETKSCEKTEKYAPLRLELKRQFPGYQVKQFNVVMDVLGGYSKELESTIRSLVGFSRGREVLLKMQKVVLSQSLNTARHFKVLT